MSNLNVKEHLRFALEQRFRAQKHEALATIQLYLENSVGVAEHSDILNEIEKWVDAGCSAEEKLKFLSEHFPINIVVSNA